MKLKNKIVVLVALIAMGCNAEEKAYLEAHGSKEIEAFYVNVYTNKDFSYLSNRLRVYEGGYRFESDRFVYPNYESNDDPISLIDQVKEIAHIYGEFINLKITSTRFFYAMDHNIYNITFYVNVEYKNCFAKEDLTIGFHKADKQKKIMVTEYNSTVIKWK